MNPRYLMSGVFRIFLVLYAEGLVFFGKWIQNSISNQSNQKQILPFKTPLPKHKCLKQRLRLNLVSLGGFGLNYSGQRKPNLRLFNQLFWVSSWVRWYEWWKGWLGWWWWTWWRICTLGSNSSFIFIIGIIVLINIFVITIVIINGLSIITILTILRLPWCPIVPSASQSSQSLCFSGSQIGLF